MIGCIKHAGTVLILASALCLAPAGLSAAGETTDTTSDPEEFLEALRLQAQSARQRVNAAKKEAKKRQDEKQGEAAKRGTQAHKFDKKDIDKARNLYEYVRDVVADMGAHPALERVLNRRDGDELLITRDNANELLANAEALLLGVQGKRQRSAPRSVDPCHQEELRELETAQKLAEQAAVLARRASLAVSAATHDAGQMRAEMARWKADLDDLTKQIDDALARADWLGRALPEPLGYYILDGLSDGAPENHSNEKYTLVIQVRCPTGAFARPLLDDYYKLQLATPGSFLGVPRDRVRTWKYDRFQLILNDGRAIPISSLALTPAHAKTLRPVSWVEQLAWTIDPAKDAAVAQTFWLSSEGLSSRECQPPFQVQLDDGMPVTVPETRLQPPAEPAKPAQRSQGAGRRPGGRR